MGIDWASFGINLGLSFLERFFVDSATGKLGDALKSYPVERMNEYLVRFGRAFGPPGIRHFSELPLSERLDLLRRVPVLRGTHTDWLKPFQWVPRTWTVWLGPAPSIANVQMGDWGGKPVPEPGQWFVLDGYMAETSPEGIHDRLGWRWDDVDEYFELSVSVKGLSR